MIKRWAREATDMLEDPDGMWVLWEDVRQDIWAGQKLLNDLKWQSDYDIAQLLQQLVDMQFEIEDLKQRLAVR